MRYVLLLLLAAAPAAAQGGVRLRYTPPVGQVSAYRTVMTSEIDMGDTRMAFEQAMYATQRVTARDGGVSTVEMVIDSISMSEPGVLAGLGAMDRLVGSTGVMRIDERGHVVEVMSDDSLLQQAAAAFSGQMSGASPGQVLFPERPVAPGATWSDSGTTTVTVGQGRMEMRRDLIYRFERLESRGRSAVAVISVTGTVGQAMTLGDAMAPAMTSEGAMRGEVLYDLAASRWVGHQLVMTMTSHMTMLPAPMEATVNIRGELLGQD